MCLYKNKYKNVYTELEIEEIYDEALDNFVTAEKELDFARKTRNNYNEKMNGTHNHNKHK